MNQKMGLMQKHGIVTIHLAEELLGQKVGDRLDTIINLSKRLGVGRGTVQTALKTLKDLDILAVEPRGHMGTMITALDYEKLLQFTGINHMVGVMPLPYSKRYEGLATGIYQTLNKTAIPVSLAFMSGADQRLQTLKDERYDFAVISKLTATHYLEQGEPIKIVVTLGDRSYVNDHRLIVSKTFKGYFDGMRIGVDYSSFDQLSMTKKYFENKTVTFVPIKYSNLVKNIKKGKIDGAIWSVEENIQLDPELKVESVYSDSHALENTRAALIVREDDVTISNFFKRFFEPLEVEAIQNQVMENKILPAY